MDGVWLTVAIMIQVMGISPVAHGPGVGPAPQRQTIWDGVFSAAQAERGRASYVAACGYCHKDDLSGGGGDEPGQSPPALVGSDFLADWRGASVAALVGTITATMPLERPKLEPQTYVDIAAYMLQMNGAWPGVTELPVDGQKLDAIVMTEAANR